MVLVSSDFPRYFGFIAIILFLQGAGLARLLIIEHS